MEMKVYKKDIRIDINDECVNRDSSLVLQDMVFDKEEVCDSWDKLDEFFDKYGAYMPFTMCDTGNNKICYFSSDEQYQSNKDSLPVIKVTTTYTETSCKFGELLQFDAEDVMRFISERIRR